MICSYSNSQENLELDSGPNKGPGRRFLLDQPLNSYHMLMLISILHKLFYFIQCKECLYKKNPKQASLHLSLVIDIYMSN